MEEIFSSIIGSGSIGAILVWFMWQHQNFLKDFTTIIMKNTESMTKANDVMEE